MNVSMGERWERFVDETLRAGRYGSASEVVREGLRLVEEREARLRALGTTLQTSIDAGGEASHAEIDAALDERAALLRSQGAAPAGEHWLRGKVAPTYDAMKADPARALSSDEVRARIRMRHAARLKGDG